MQTPRSSGLRFATASVAALAADFLLTLALHAVSPLPLHLCAAISFAAVGCAFYFVHEHWTFHDAASRNSPARMAKNLVVLACAFLARVASSPPWSFCTGRTACWLAVTSLPGPAFPFR